MQNIRYNKQVMVWRYYLSDQFSGGIQMRRIRVSAALTAALCAGMVCTSTVMAAPTAVSTGSSGTTVTAGTSAKTKNTAGKTSQNKAKTDKKAQTKTGQTRQYVYTKQELKKGNNAYKKFLTKQDGKYYAYCSLYGTNMKTLVVTDEVDPNNQTQAYSCTVYQYVNGKVKKAGTIESTSTAYPISVTQQNLVYRGHHYMAMVSARDGSLSGFYYLEKTQKKGPSKYYQYMINDGKVVKKTKTKISKKVGTAHINGYLGKKVIFKAVSK